jgi:hypothetical protein
LFNRKVKENSFNFKRDSYDEALSILLKLIKTEESTETSKDSTIFDDLSILLSSRRYYHRLNEVEFFFLNF